MRRFPFSSISLTSSSASLPTSRFQVRGSLSTKSGTPPFRMTAVAQEMMVKVGITT